MRKVFLIIAIVVAIIPSCTDFSFEGAPASMTVKLIDNHTLTKKTTEIMISVESGEKWEISSRPAWIDLVSIEQANSSPYEWLVIMHVYANDEYNRSGKIVFKTTKQSEVIGLSQMGPKGDM